MVTPIVSNNGNFTKPTGDKPSLLTFEEASTLFHEFGHALHDLLSNCTYEALAGTNVPRDFVELPLADHGELGLRPEVIKTYAKHYQTGEPIPQDLVDKIKRADLFNQGFATVEYLLGLLSRHGLARPDRAQGAGRGRLREGGSMDKIGLIPEIVVRYRSPYFQHIFSRRVFGRLLQLHLVRGPGRRRLRGLQGEEPFRPKTADELPRQHLLARATRQTRWCCTRASAAASPRSSPCSSAAAC